MYTPTQLIDQAFALANQYVVTDIECNCVDVVLDGGHRWYDTRPMLDLREHSPTYVDINAEAINFALQVGLAAQHPQRPYLLRLVHGRHITEEAAG